MKSGAEGQVSFMCYRSGAFPARARRVLTIHGPVLREQVKRLRHRRWQARRLLWIHEEERVVNEGPVACWAVVRLRLPVDSILKHDPELDVRESRDCDPGPPVISRRVDTNEVFKTAAVRQPERTDRVR